VAHLVAAPLCDAVPAEEMATGSRGWSLSCLKTQWTLPAGIHQWFTALLKANWKPSCTHNCYFFNYGYFLLKKANLYNYHIKTSTLLPEIAEETVFSLF